MIPDEDLPVDPKRLKKAIKTALIKNDNNPDKIDIQNIMREQVRIHKHIQDYRSVKTHKNTGGVKASYFSSRIVSKIAEDHIHNSLKKIDDAMAHNPGGQDGSKSAERIQQSPTKFQKLLASKFNTGFKSVLKDFYKAKKPSHSFTSPLSIRDSKPNAERSPEAKSERNSQNNEQ